MKKWSLAYRPYRWTAKTPIEQWPSIYVFCPVRKQVVDLTDGCLSPPFSQRVSRQDACLISFVVFQTNWMNLERGGRDFPWEIDYECNPELLMILKLRPQGDWNKAELPEPSWYFPPTDPIYQDLARARAPFFRRYAT